MIVRFFIVLSLSLLVIMTAVADQIDSPFERSFPKPPPTALSNSTNNTLGYVDDQTSSPEDGSSSLWTIFGLKPDVGIPILIGVAIGGIAIGGLIMLHCRRRCYRNRQQYLKPEHINPIDHMTPKKVNAMPKGWTPNSDFGYTPINQFIPDPTMPRQRSPNWIGKLIRWLKQPKPSDPVEKQLHYGT